jgi:hypothetical protein
LESLRQNGSFQARQATLQTAYLSMTHSIRRKSLFRRIRPESPYG